MNQEMEYWLSGPVDNVPALLQPVAHALLQSVREVTNALHDFPESLIWEKPAENASVAFHLQHLSGVTDRLFTYAQSKQLSQDQLDYLKSEGQPNESLTLSDLLKGYRKQVLTAIEQLRNTPESVLKEPRGVGRKQIPSTVIGLLFHAAEHAQRHTGQLLVTAKVLKSV